MLQNDPGGSPASSLVSKLKSEKSSFLSFFVTSKFEFGPWANPWFPRPLGLSFYMRSLKCSNCLGKPVRAPRGAQKYANFEKLTPKITKMSFFMKFKTSPTLPPYYSIEPKKYALRVICHFPRRPTTSCTEIPYYSLSLASRIISSTSH